MKLSKLKMNLLKNLVLVISSIIVFSCGAKKDITKIYTETPTEYNVYIQKRYDAAMNQWNKTLTLMEDSAKVYPALDSMSIIANNSITELNKLADNHGDSTFKKTVIELLTYFDTTVKGKLKEAIDIGMQKEVSDSLYLRYTTIGNEIGSEKDELIEKVELAQKLFIDKIEKSK